MRAGAAGRCRAPAHHRAHTTPHTPSFSDKKKDEVASARRAGRCAPRVVVLLPLSASADARAVWDAIVEGCRPDGGGEGMVEATPAPSSGPLHLSPTDKRRPRLLLLPPLPSLDDPLAVLDLVKAADVLVLVADGAGGTGAADAGGAAAAALARALGAPSTLAVATGASPTCLKARSAAKRRAAAAAEAALPGRAARALAVGGAGDGAALVRALTDAPAPTPAWRAARGQVVVESASIGADGALRLVGHVRGAPLPATAIVHVPGAGDFHVDSVLAAPEPGSALAPPTPGGSKPPAPPSSGALLATAPLTDREPLVREAEPEDEGAWPSREDMDAAVYAAAAATRARAAAARLPDGTSEYQASWYVDGVDYGSEEEEEGAGPPSLVAATPASDDGMASASDSDDGATVAGDADEYASDGDPAALKAAWRAADDDAAWPDEVDVPPGAPARTRFARYRGLKSWRASPWDAGDGAPPEFGRVFALDDARRARRAARAAAAAAGAPGGPPGVAPGARVELVLAGVPVDAAASVVDRVAAFAAGDAPPLCAFALLQHEGRLSVMHYALKTTPALTTPIKGKTELLLTTGVRTHAARPMWSADEHSATKFRLHRWLQPGAAAVATAYAPIAHAPLPALAFTRAGPAGVWTLIATGGVRGPDPDRVVLKKAVLTGAPARVHKRKAVVRWMFVDPDDVRWFRPVELWTRSGRRGRIKEPVGTHGAMKCVFDGLVSQTDAVCLSLFKRAVPPWPPGDVWTG